MRPRSGSVKWPCRSVGGPRGGTRGGDRDEDGVADGLEPVQAVVRAAAAAGEAERHRLERLPPAGEAPEDELEGAPPSAPGRRTRGRSWLFGKTGRYSPPRGRHSLPSALRQHDLAGVEPVPELARLEDDPQPEAAGSPATAARGPGSRCGASAPRSRATRRTRPGPPRREAPPRPHSACSAWSRTRREEGRRGRRRGRVGLARDAWRMGHLRNGRSPGRRAGPGSRGGPAETAGRRRRGRPVSTGRS